MDLSENPAASQARGGSPADVRIYLMGAGITFPEHLTIETIEILSKCVRICTNLREEQLSGLPDDLREKCFSLWPLYQHGRNRTDNYLDVLQAVLDVAEANAPIAWLTPGHPIIFDSVSAWLLKEGKSRGWTVRAIAAVSSIDTLLAELGYDPAGGMLIHEATALFRRKVPIVPAVGTMLLQPSVFNLDVAVISDGHPGPDLSLLRDYICQFHSGDHDCALIRSGSVIGERDLVTWLKIKDLPSVPHQNVQGTTMFIPPA